MYGPEAGDGHWQSVARARNDGSLECLYGRSTEGATHWIALPEPPARRFAGRLDQGGQPAMYIERAKIHLNHRTGEPMLGASRFGRFLSELDGLLVRLDLERPVQDVLEGRLRVADGGAYVGDVALHGMLMEHVGGVATFTVTPVLEPGVLSWSTQKGATDAAPQAAVEALRPIMAAFGMDGADVGIYVAGEAQGEYRPRGHFSSGLRTMRLDLSNPRIAFGDVDSLGYNDLVDFLEHQDVTSVERVLAWPLVASRESAQGSAPDARA